MHAVDFLQDLAVVLIVAGSVTVVFHRLKQPVVLGYILAGVIIGPHTPPFPLIHDEESINTFAELGVIFLMFGLGLHFSLRQLASVGLTALLAAAIEIVLMGLVGFGLGRLFGWSAMDSLFLGAILSISSTTIIVKALEELGLAKERFADIVFGILIVEDILAVALLALLSSIAMTGSLEASTLVFTFGRLALFLTVTLVVGLLTVPPLLRYVGRFRSDEMLLVTVLGLCFGVSLLAVKLGYSVALGAFLIGAVVAEAREIGRIDALVRPVRDLFSAIFFVAIGLLIDPRLLAEHALPIAAITVACVVGKVVACSSGVFLAGHEPRTALRAGMGVAQIGEFSFIIAQLGLTLAVTSDFLYPVAVAVSAVTTLLTPYLIKSSDRVIDRLERGRASRSVLNVLRLYTDALTRWRAAATSGVDPRRAHLRQFLVRWLIQMGVNVALITALLAAAVWLGRGSREWMPVVPPALGGPEALIWLGAILLALPILVAALRNIRALAAILAEISVVTSAGPAQAAIQRAVVRGVLTGAASLAVLVWLLVLSAAVLPPWPALLALTAVVALVAVLMWRSFIRVYSKAEVALRDTLTQPPNPVEVHDPAPLSPILQNADLETVLVPERSPAAGKLIREIALRTRTGASVVGIERAGQSLVNPGPDEEVLPGDKVLLLGVAGQLRAARALIGGD